MTLADRTASRVAIVTDNPYRDLPGIVLLARRLARDGVACWLVPTSLVWRELGAIAPTLTVLNNLRGPRHELASWLLDAGSHVAVLETEGGVMPDFETYTTLARPNPALFARVSRVCAWGPRVAQFVVDSGWFTKSQVVVTGAPRFDFYAPQWRDAACRASAELDDLFTPPLILVNGSFPRGNPLAFDTASAPVSQRPDEPSEKADRFRRIEREALIGMAAVAVHLADVFPAATVVYRPHPFENLQTYETVMPPRPNLKLLKVGTVDGWILRASVVVHRNSTTAIEAALSGVPALLPGWLPVAETLEVCDAVSIRCEDEAELDRHVADALARTWRPTPEGQATTADVIEAWFHRVDGLAHERVAKALLPCVGDHRRLDLTRFREMHFAGWRPSTLSGRAAVSTRVRRWLGVPPSWSFGQWRHVDRSGWWAASDKFFDAAMVDSLLRRIDPDAPVARARQAEAVDYPVRCRDGRSVIIEPTS